MPESHLCEVTGKQYQLERDRFGFGLNFDGGMPDSTEWVVRFTAS